MGLGGSVLGAGFGEVMACSVSALVGCDAGSMVFGALLDVNVSVPCWNALIGKLMMEVSTMYNAGACPVIFSKFVRKASFMRCGCRFGNRKR